MRSNLEAARKLHKKAHDSFASHGGGGGEEREDGETPDVAAKTKAPAAQSGKVRVRVFPSF